MSVYVYIYNLMTFQCNSVVIQVFMRTLKRNVTIKVCASFVHLLLSVKPNRHAWTVFLVINTTLVL